MNNSPIFRAYCFHENTDQKLYEMRHSGLVSGNHFYGPGIFLSKRSETEGKYFPLDVSHLRNRLPDRTDQSSAEKSILVHTGNCLYRTDLYCGVSFRDISEKKEALPLGLQPFPLEYRFRDPAGLYPLLVCHRASDGKTCA